MKLSDLTSTGMSAALICLFCFAAADAQSGEKPNVVVIFADDLGYGDLSCYGATKVQTPNIDKLAAEGRSFTDAHSASAVCTPSRYALMTGEYPHRKNLYRPVFLKTGLVIDTQQQTVASVMKGAGYATACIGKWHLGFGQGAPDWNGELKPGPLELGFDYYFGVPVVNSHPPFVYVENHRVVGLVADDPFVFGQKARTREFPEKMGMDQMGGAEAAHALYDDEAVGTTLLGKAVDWIKGHAENPFFLYLATTNIHHPFTPAPRFKGTSQCGRYGDFIHELDWMVGEVMKTLAQQGVADNTLVIFTSDNGGMFNVGGQDAWDAGHRLNGELLGFKFGAWEGGHRVPFIARWPGKIEAGSTSDQLISNIDMIATFAALTGSTLRQGQGRDSVNILPALTGEPKKPLRDHIVLAPNKPTHLAVRKEKWMYIGAQGSGGFTAAKRGAHAFGGPAAISYAGYKNSDIENGKIKPDAPPAQLYDLENDLKQTTNLYRKRPDVVKELKALLESYAPPKLNTDAPAEPKYDGFKPLGELRFTFESGQLDGWSIVEGAAGRPISGHASLPRWKNKPFNREGRFHLSTIATADGFSDKQQVVFQSPRFIIHGGRASFLASGGFASDSLFVGLFDAETKDVLLTAGGPKGPQMKRTIWDVSKLRGKTVFLRVVDKNTGGWGHLTFDDFSVDGKLIEFESIFNGRDLSGWEGIEGAWEVRDGAIWCTGEKGNQWLIYRGGVYTDLELRLQFKYLGGNSGVQVRSAEFEPFQVRGYQAEIASQDKMGLWHHSKPPEKYRSKLSLAGQKVHIAANGNKTVEQVSPAPDIQAVYHEGQWNEMVITACGDRLVHKINGVVFSELIDEETKYKMTSGVIALQDHGSGTQVGFKDIRLRELEQSDCR